MVNSDEKWHFTIQEKSLVFDFFKLFANIFKVEVRIGAKCSAKVTMPHQQLKSLWIHTTLCHVGAISMSAHMGSDLWQLLLIETIVLFADVLKILLPM